MREEFRILLPFCKGIRNFQCEGNPMEIRITNGHLFKALRKVAPKKFTQNAMAYALGVNTHNLSQFEIGVGKIKSVPFNPLMIDTYITRVNEYHAKGNEYFKEHKTEITSPKRVPNDFFVDVDAEKHVTMKDLSRFEESKYDDDSVMVDNVELSEEDEELIKKLYETAVKFVDEFNELVQDPFSKIKFD